MGKDRQKREIDEIVRELKIIREQLRHPNIVRYYSTFQESKNTTGIVINFLKYLPLNFRIFTVPFKSVKARNSLVLATPGEFL